MILFFSAVNMISTTPKIYFNIVTSIFCLMFILQSTSSIAQLKPMPRYVSPSQNLVKAGELLFQDKILSGRRNINCLECHNPQKGGSDDLPLSLGQGLEPIGPHKSNRKILRNSMSLFNLKHPDNKVFFWDGKVSYTHNDLRTPVRELNGVWLKEERVFDHIKQIPPISPERSRQAREILSWINHPLDLANIVPLLSPAEMLGNKEDHQVRDPMARAVHPFDIWQEYVNRVVRERPRIVNLLRHGFRLQPHQSLNIAHIGVALSEFIGQEFQITNSPYDRFLRGERSLTQSQIRGFALFKMHCTSCHGGATLSGPETTHSHNRKEFRTILNDKDKPIVVPNRDFIPKIDHHTAFSSVFVPAIGILHEPFKSHEAVAAFNNPWPHNNTLDKGREKSQRDVVSNKNFAFKIPPLRGINQNAPYFHNGVFQNLEEVVEHYSDARRSLQNFTRLPPVFRRLYGDQIMALSGNFPNHTDQVWSGFMPQPEELKAGLFLSRGQKADLVNFLKAFD